MKVKHINVVYSTNLNENDAREFNGHISNTIGCGHDIYPYVNHNDYSLPEIYNKSINSYHNSEDEIFVFIHHDLVFKTKGWGKILLNKFNNFDVDIIGLAGTRYLSKNAVWWSKKEHMYGIVEHTNGITNWINDYGSNFKGLKNVVVVDGLFIAVNPNNIVHGFNEDFDGFHFYEIPFCIDNYIDGCNVAVTNEIRVLHKSIGETDDAWEKNRELFIEKYKQYLPVILEDEL